MKINVFCWHDLQRNNNFIINRTVLWIPAFAVIIGDAIISNDRELIADILLIFRIDRLDSGPVISSLDLECQSIFISVIVYL